MAHLMQMNLVNLSTAIHRLAKITANDPRAQAELRNHPALDELQAAIASALAVLGPGEAQPQSLSNVAWSLATIRLLNWPLLQVVAALSITNISLFKPFELSTMLWAFAKLGAASGYGESSGNMRPFFQAAANHITKNLHEFGFRCLATSSWAFATARQRHARLFRAIAAQMIPMVHAANCQEIANTAWAFGTADFHDDQLFQALAEKALLELPEFKPQELSNLLWGFATNGFFHEGLFANSALVARRMNLQAQHLANILWAFARVQPRHPVTQTTTLSLLPLCIAQLESFKPQEVSSTALAVAKAFGQVEVQPGDHADQLPTALSRAASGDRGVVVPPPPVVIEFFRAVMPWALPRLSEFSVQSLANMVSAYAMVHVPGSGPVFAGIGQEVLNRYDALEPTALVHLLKGFSSAPPDAGCGKVFGVLAASVARNIEELRPHELQTLSRICAEVLGPNGKARDAGCDTGREELRGRCIALSAAGYEGELAGFAPPLPLAPPPLSALPPAIRVALAAESDGLHASPPLAVCGPRLEDHLVTAGWGSPPHHTAVLPPSLVDDMDLEPWVDGASPSHGIGVHPSQWPPLDGGYGTHDDRRMMGSVGTKTHPRIINKRGPVPHPNANMNAGARPVLAAPASTWRRMEASEDNQGHMRTISELSQRMLPAAAAADTIPTTFGYTIPTAFALGGEVSHYQHPFAPNNDSGQPFRCSVKNSFLHFSGHQKEDDDNEKEGSASQRSSSVPSRFKEEHMDDWHLRNPQHRIQPEQEETDWSVQHPEMRQLDFDWGVPVRRPISMPQGMFTVENVPTRGPLAAALAASRYDL